MKEIFPEMKEKGIYFHNFAELTKKEKIEISEYFAENVLPVLTPLCLDSAHPFPRLINRSLNIVFVLNDNAINNNEQKLAFLQIPSVISRFVKLKRNSGNHYVMLEQIIKAHGEMLFPGLEIEASNTFRVTRDADIEIAEDEAEDLLMEIAEQIKHRKWGRAAVRLEVSVNMPQFLVNLLMQALDLDYNDVYAHSRPLNLPDFMELTSLRLRNLKDKPFQTRILPELLDESISIFDVLKNKDLMVHHPYDSFTNSVLRFMNEAATDPNVLAIKITLYRTGMNSPVVAALKQAAENGKDVTAFVELKARFDEENNIIWAKELEQYGIHVVYGVLGLKTHCKIAMVVRKEQDSLKTYLHMSTGNYNHSTSRLYTDIGMFTSRDEFKKDAIYLFNYLTGYSYHNKWENLIVAPVRLRRQLIEFINREIERHTPENPGMIFAKMNSLAHDEVIQSLYRASIKGVKVKLLVRGVCCLQPGLKDISENIEVRSILGRFLEHSRIFYFKNGGDEEFYLSSADWMTRNLHKRVELMFPILDEKMQKELMNLLEIYWADNSKSWRLLSDGSYEKIQPMEGEADFSAQNFFLESTKQKRIKSPKKTMRYI
jgi:polyphosphate kinase